MKERVVLFSDAVIAIILTIMVLELKVTFTNGQLDLMSLLRGIGIYFISFCFVANIWFQTAQRFNKVETVKNKALVFYLISLFFLSLVPMATGLIIEDTTQEVVTMYGILTMIVTYLTQSLNLALASQASSEQNKAYDYEVNILKKRHLVNIGLRISLLVFAYFFVTAGLVIYLLLPILAFLQNMVDREEEEFVKQMDTEQAEFYAADEQKLWGNSLNKYSRLLTSALRDSRRKGEELSPTWWDEFNDAWHTQLNLQVQEIESKISQPQAEIDRRQLEAKLGRLQQEKARIEKKIARQDKERRKEQSLDQYKHQLKDALAESEDAGVTLSPEWWEKFNSDWRDQLNSQKNEITESMDQAHSDLEKKHLANELKRLHHDQERLEKKITKALADQKKLQDKKS